MPAHVGQLELKLEVGHRTQAAHNNADALRAREFDGQAGVTHHLDVFHFGQHAARQRHAFVDIEERRLARVRRDRHQHGIEDAGRPAHQVLVAAGDGIEGSGIHGFAGG